MIPDFYICFAGRAKDYFKHGFTHYRGGAAGVSRVQQNTK